MLILLPQSHTLHLILVLDTVCQCDVLDLGIERRVNNLCMGPSS